MDVYKTAEFTARKAYGRLLAYLAVRFHDISAAEDALSDAFLKALNTWPINGIPKQPDAWLLVTARRQLIDEVRRNQTQARILKTLQSDYLDSRYKHSKNSEQADGDHELWQDDDRLKLLFACAHPAINPTIHTPLMLQTVLGLNAAQIASSFLIAPKTMGQRLVRAKAKIRDARIPFKIPLADELPKRLNAVLDAIYAAYTTGWDDGDGSDVRTQGLTQEAIWLARLCVALMPAESEPRGLLALMLYCESRQAARRTPTGEYIPLSQQDPTLWLHSMIKEAEQYLKQASSTPKIAQTLGRFQLEAAIQSVHAHRAIMGQTDWQTIIQLYEGLIYIAPTVGALISQAGAIARHQGPNIGLSHLNTLTSQIPDHYQPYWALKAHLLKQIGDNKAAYHAYTQAIGLTENQAIRKFLMNQQSQS